MKIVIGFQWICIIGLFIFSFRMTSHVNKKEAYYKDISKEIHEFQRMNYEQLNALTLEREAFIKERNWKGRLTKRDQNLVQYYNAEINRIKNQNLEIAFIRCKSFDP